MTPWGSLH